MRIGSEAKPVLKIAHHPLNQRLVLCAVGLVSSTVDTGCLTHSIKEQMILSKLPESYRKHNTGFSIPPAEAEVAEAIQMGAADKDDLLVQYAHTFKPNLSTYIFLQSPLYLIADYARDRAREYREPDPEFVAYCRGLDAVRIALQEQHQVRYFYTFALQYNVILLRDGKRVEPLTKIQAFKGMNPFMKLGKEIETLLQGSTAMSQAIMQRSQVEIRKALKDIPPEVLADMPPAKQALLKYISGQSTSPAQPEENAEVDWPVTEFDGLFSASELKKPGKYEVVFRTQPTANLLFRGDAEKRYPISFEKFK